MTAIGITGSYGGLNMGDEAILTSMVASLRARIPDLSLTVFSRGAAHTRAHHQVESVVPVRDLTRDEAAAHLAPLDLLLLGGGGILHDGEVRTYLREVRLAQQLGVGTMAYAVGAGPLLHSGDWGLINETLSQMRAVTVRDVGAKRTLEHVDVDCPVEVTADPALLLAPEPFPQERLRQEGVPAGSALVAMSLREPGPAAPDIDVEGSYAVLAHTADFIVDRFDAEIVFIPMERSDVRLSHAVIARMTCAEHAHVLRGHYRPGELLGIMSHMDFAVGMRLHVLIFAAVAGIPMFPLPYASKVSCFVEALGVAAPPPIARDSVGQLLAAMDRAWDLRRHDAEQQRGPVAALRERAARTVDVAVDCLNVVPLRAAVG